MITIICTYVTIHSKFVLIYSKLVELHIYGLILLKGQFILYRENRVRETNQSIDEMKKKR